MRMTLAQKIIARAAGRPHVDVGEVVTCAVDLAMIHDSGGPRRVQPILDQLGAGLWDPNRVVLISDHYLPVFDEETRVIAEQTRAFAVRHRLPYFYDGEGICHVVLPERGHLRPGQLVVGGDSHSPTGGAFGAFMFGVGSTEMASVLVTGEIWLQTPETVVIEWNGRLAPGVTAKDIMLYLCGALGPEGGRSGAVEFRGEALARLSMQERMTLSNMTAELGAQTGLFPPDAITVEAIRRAGGSVDDVARWHSDPDAAVAAHHRFDANTLEPQVAAPHSPANTQPVSAFAQTRIDVAYIGACTGAKLIDLQRAAAVLRGRKIAPGVTLLVAPASRLDQEQAAREGVMAVFEEAGAKILANSCGMCAGYGGALDEDKTCISSTARNFKGRMGPASSPVYLGSPYTVAAAAVTGEIVDPRELLSGEAA